MDSAAQVANNPTLDKHPEMLSVDPTEALLPMVVGELVFTLSRGLRPARKCHRKSLDQFRRKVPIFPNDVSRCRVRRTRFLGRTGYREDRTGRTPWGMPAACWP